MGTVPAPTGNATTDTANINAAIAAGGEVVFQPGLYRVNPLTAVCGMKWRGAGPGGYGIESPDAYQTHIGLAAGSNAHMLTIPSGAANVVIEDIFFDANKNNNSAGDAIHASDVTTGEQLNLRLNRVHIEAPAGNGVYIGTGRIEAKVSVLESLYCGGAGIVIKGSDTVWDGCLVANGVDGIQVGSVITRILNCDIWGSRGAGIHFLPYAAGALVSGCGIDRHQKQAILIDANCSGIVISGNIFHSNSQSADGAYSHIDVQSTVPNAATIDLNSTFYDGGIVVNTAQYLVNQAAGATPKIGSGNLVVPGSTLNGLTNLA